MSTTSTCDQAPRPSFDALAAWHIFQGFCHGLLASPIGHNARCTRQNGTATLNAVPGGRGGQVRLSHAPRPPRRRPPPPRRRAPPPAARWRRWRAPRAGPPPRAAPAAAGRSACPARRPPAGATAAPPAAQQERARAASARAQVGRKAVHTPSSGGASSELRAPSRRPSRRCVARGETPFWAPVSAWHRLRVWARARAIRLRSQV